MEGLGIRKKEGFVTPAVLLVFVILFLIIGSLSLYVASGLKFLHAYENYYNNREGAEEILEKIIKDFQIVRYSDYDSPNSMEIEDLKTKYDEYMLTIKDCSSGIGNVVEGNVINREASTVSKASDFSLEEVSETSPIVNESFLGISRIVSLLGLSFCHFAHFFGIVAIPIFAPFFP